MGVMRVPVANVQVGDVMEWGPVKTHVSMANAQSPVLGTMQSRASLTSMRTVAVRKVLLFVDCQQRPYIVFCLDDKQRMQATVQTVLLAGGRTGFAQTAAARNSLESHPAVYLNSNVPINVHRRLQE